MLQVNEKNYSSHTLESIKEFNNLENNNQSDITKNALNMVTLLDKIITASKSENPVNEAYINDLFSIMSLMIDDTQHSFLIKAPDMLKQMINEMFDKMN